MSLLKRNILANFVGKGWSVLIGLIFLPIYIRILGIEAYGIVGFYAALQSMLNILDFGLSATINREMARYSVQPEKADQARDLARSLESIYWLVGTLIAIVLYFSSTWLTSEWIKIQTLPKHTVEVSLSMMGIAIALQWPARLYSGGLLGLERQVLQNSVIAICSVIRNCGAVLVLWLAAPTLPVYFGWQLIANGVQVLLMAISFWWSMPKGSRAAKFDLESIRKVWRFTVGMGAAGLAGLLLSQIDKIILSNILPLTLFTYYTVATQISTAIRMTTSSISTAFLPRMSALIAKKEEQELRYLYHQVCQFVSAVVMPICAVLFFFSSRIIEIWTQNAILAKEAGPVASALVVGSTFSGIIGVPYDLTIARGWAVYGLYQNTISAILFVPMIIVATSYFSGVGAAFSWLILNVGLFIIAAPIIHNRVLRGELSKWYTVDNIYPFMLSFLVVSIGWWLSPKGLGYLFDFFYIGFLWFLASIACGTALPLVKVIIVNTMSQIREMRLS